MTKDRDFKSVVRARMAHTGETYTAAREHLVAGESERPDARERRIVGLETRYTVSIGGVDGTGEGAEEAVRLLPRRLPRWGRSQNVYLANGGRLYVSGRSTLEYATPECDSIKDLVSHVVAGDVLIASLAQGAQDQQTEHGNDAPAVLDRGRDGGCHESYLSAQPIDERLYTSVLVPFLASRQLLAGAGHVMTTARGPLFMLSPRAEHLWEVLPPTPLRKTKAFLDPNAPPLAAEHYRRLHVSAGDANRSQVATFLKVGTTCLVIRLLEQRHGALPDLTLENPLRAVREISHDISVRRPVRMADGRTATALEMQGAVLDAVENMVDLAGATAEERQVLALWRSTVERLDSQPASLVGQVDWVTKLMTGSASALHDRALGPNYLSDEAEATRVACIELDTLTAVEAVGGTFCTANEVARAANNAPRTTRAHLRGELIKASQREGRSYTADWVHFRFRDYWQRTIMLTDPLSAEDPRVDTLIATIGDGPTRNAHGRSPT